MGTSLCVWGWDGVVVVVHLEGLGSRRSRLCAEVVGLHGVKIRVSSI